MKRQWIVIIVLVGICILYVIYLYPPAKSSISQTLSLPPASILIECDTVDLGVVLYNEKINTSFTFHNTGSSPLLIRSVVSSCSCTTIEWSKRPISYNEKIKLNVVFDANSLGYFMKLIDVMCNTEQQRHKLYLIGEVVNYSKTNDSE